MEREQTSDYHQILAYMFRFDAKVGYLIYPEIEKNNTSALKEEVFILRKGLENDEPKVKRRREIKVKKLGLIIKQASSYDDFVAEMAKVEQQLREEIQQNKQ